MRKKLSPIVLPVEEIQQCILFIRNEKVMLDAHLAILYGTQTKVLIQAVRRNIMRFPTDFMFQLTEDESQNLRSQNVTSSWGGRRHFILFTIKNIIINNAIMHRNKKILCNFLFCGEYNKAYRNPQKPITDPINPTTLARIHLSEKE